MALGLSVANDIASTTLTHYVRGKAFAQTIQDKPLLRILRGAQQSFPGGKDNISFPVQGAFMSDTAGFLAGYTEDEQLVFRQAANVLRAYYPWREHHAGLIISWTELKKDGITITDDQKVSEHSQVDLIRLTGILENRLSDFGESYSRAFNTLLWGDGTGDTEAIAGIQAILISTPAVGTTGGLNRATYSWWRHRQNLGIAMSEEDQTLSKTLRSEVRQLRRYGGKPNVALAGSDFLEALEAEFQAKGSYTNTGFSGGGKNELGIAEVSLRGLGTFQYDPTLDDLGLDKYCFCIDTERLKLRPMEGEDDKILNPTRPYDYLVFLKSMTWTGGLVSNQLNAHGVYSIA